MTDSSISIISPVTWSSSLYNRLEYIHHWRRHMSRRIHSTLRGFQTTRRTMSFNSLCKEALSSGKKVIAVDADDVLASTNAKVAESGYCPSVSTFG